MFKFELASSLIDVSEMRPYYSVHSVTSVSRSECY